VANPAQTDANLDGFGDDCVDPAASICATAVLGYGVVVEENVTIGCFTTIGDRTQLGTPGGAAPPTTIGDFTRIGEGCFVGDDVEIGDFVRVGDDGELTVGTRLANFVRFGDRAQLAMAIVDVGVRAGDDVDMHDAPEVGPWTVVGNGSTVVGPLVIHARVRIGDDAFIGEGADIADYARIGDRATLPLGAHVGPFSVVGADFTGNSTFSVGAFSFIGPRCDFFDVVLGNWVFVGHDTSIRRGIAIGDHSFVGHDVTIDLLDVDFPPFTFIAPNATLP
jgi:UDP-3-O-[3-hydroxymyristoyl] glucosamine N-acyltransferase